MSWEQRQKAKQYSLSLIIIKQKIEHSGSVSYSTTHSCGYLQAVNHVQLTGFKFKILQNYKTT